MLSNLFNRFFKKNSEAIDRSLGYPNIEIFRNYLLNGQFDKFELGYDLLHWSERTLVVEGCCFDQKYKNEIERWSKTHSDSHQAHLFLGVSLTHQAWEVRTAQVADKLSEMQTKRFISLLELALEHLQFADEINSNDPETCARIVRVLMGLGADEETTNSWFLGAKALENNHLYAHLAMLNYLTPKWHGSVEKMNAFADKYYRASDTGILSILPLFAMVEEWLFLEMKGELEAHENFFNQGQQRTYILQIQARFIETPENEALAPIFYNYLTFLMALIGEPEMVRVFAPKFINGKMTEYPWAYLGIENHTELQKHLRC